MDMATFRFRSNRWQARVRRKGYPDETKSFATRQDAEKWARALETEIDRGLFVDISEAQRTTFGDLIARYLVEVTSSMKGAPADTIRLKAIMRKPIAQWSMANLSAARIAAYRDERLKEVSGGTVIRELAYISAIVNHARREWGINVPNPVQMVRKPQSPQARSKVLTEEEVSKLLQALEPTGRQNNWTKPAVQLALATAMRRGELLALRWEYIDLEARTAFLPDTKNGESRTVPLSTTAVQVLAVLPRHISGMVIPVKYFTLDAAFKRACKRAGLDDVRFHDLRRTAITRMAEKLPNVIELAAVSGHKSLMVLKRYYQPKAEALALKLG
jgi:integrase